MMYVLDQQDLVPSAMVYPGSTEEVQQVVRWANNYRIPIFPISMGRNCEAFIIFRRGLLVTEIETSLVGYGGAAPRVPGSVLVDLGKRMNKILDINPDDYTCLVEPGVSFFALHDEITKRGYDHMWIDTPDVGGGSVLGNTLDRGVGVYIKILCLLPLNLSSLNQDI